MKVMYCSLAGVLILNLISSTFALLSLAELDGFLELPLMLLKGTRSQEVCFPRLGCFANYGIYMRSHVRPISVVPQTPQHIGTTHYLYTRRNPNMYQVLDSETDIKTSNFNPNLQTKFIVHGFKAGVFLGSYQQVNYILTNFSLKLYHHNFIFIEINLWTKRCITWWW